MRGGEGAVGFFVEAIEDSFDDACQEIVVSVTFTGDGTGSRSAIQLGAIARNLSTQLWGSIRM